MMNLKNIAAIAISSFIADTQGDFESKMCQCGAVQLSDNNSNLQVNFLHDNAPYIGLTNDHKNNNCERCVNDSAVDLITLESSIVDLDGNDFNENEIECYKVVEHYHSGLTYFCRCDSSVVLITSEDVNDGDNMQHIEVNDCFYNDCDKFDDLEQFKESILNHITNSEA